MRIDLEKWAELQKRLESFGDREPFLSIESGSERYVRLEGDPEAFLVPYLPFVGPDYERGGTLVYASAQNATGGDVAAWWPSCIGRGSDSVRRLYHDASRAMDDRFGNGPFEPFRVARTHVPIQPITDGPLLALAGLLELAARGRAVESLDEVLSGIACGNYYKFSMTIDGKNVDPSRFLPERRTKYSRLMADHFIVPELTVLEPRFVIALKSAGPYVLEDAAKAVGVHRVFRVNDPSWILQGMGGAGGTNGKWARAVQDQSLPDEVQHLIDNYLGQMGTRYQGGKRMDTATYLRMYWMEFKRALST